MNAAAILSLGFLCVIAQAGLVKAQDAPFKGKTVRVIVGFRREAARMRKGACWRAISESIFPAIRH